MCLETIFKMIGKYPHIKVI